MAIRVATVTDPIAQYLLLDRFDRPYRSNPWFLVATVLFMGAAVSAGITHAWFGLATSPFVFFWVGLVNLLVDHFRFGHKQGS